MTLYVNQNEIQASLKVLVKQYIEECEQCQELPKEFVSLIKHNFLAKYVYYNKAKKHIEIGIEASNSPETYPDIKIYKFPIKKASDWLEKSFKTGEADLQFYGKLLHKSATEVVLLK